jgi:hypothetical protein
METRNPFNWFRAGLQVELKPRGRCARRATLGRRDIEGFGTAFNQANWNQANSDQAIRIRQI